jgi:protein-disulfide isomerase
MIALLRSLLLAATFFCVAGGAHAAQLTPDEDRQVRAIVRDYLLKNPEILEEMQAVLDAKKALATRARLAPKLERDPRKFAVGPANSKVAVIEFFDYRCPYCKAAFDWTEAKMKTNKDVRFIFVEFPILGPNSLEASKAAIASMKQGRYLAFHNAMMRAKGDLNSKQIDGIAKSVGLDVARMRRDMNDPAIMGLLQEDQDIAAGEGINATPTFLINGQTFSGFKPEEMDNALKAIRTRK